MATTFDNQTVGLCRLSYPGPGGREVPRSGGQTLANLLGTPGRAIAPGAEEIPKGPARKTLSDRFGPGPEQALPLLWRGRVSLTDDAGQ